MTNDGEILEFGASRRKRVAGALIALALVGSAGGYLATRGGGGGRPAAHVTTNPATSFAPAPLPAPSAVLPPWPQRAGACGSTAFLPIVTARPLQGTTGIRAVVGDRLTTVDVDTGTAVPASGLPRGEFASGLATTGNGTYALLLPCEQTAGARSTVVRVEPSGAVRTVARGPYGQLLSGGDHIWAAVWSESGSTVWLDALDGTRRHRMPADFAPIGAFRNLVIGTVNPPTGPANGVSRVEVLDPVTGHVVRTLGSASSVTVSRGVVVWAGPNCTLCHVQTYDLATGARTTTRAGVQIAPWLWSGVVSPDRRTMAILRERSTPAPYEMDHPGNPNEIVTVDLRTGALQPVPGVVLFAKALPGLTFSADSRWLLISLDEGTGVRLLVWRPGLPAPLQSPARLTAKVAYSPGLATLG